MNVDIVIKAVELIVKVLDVTSASKESRDRIALAIQEGRPVTEAELDESFDNLQDAIDKARED